MVRSHWYVADGEVLAMKVNDGVSNEALQPGYRSPGFGQS
jgi:hypothetical protein